MAEEETTSEFVLLEREVVAWIASMFGLTVDAGLYRGGIPTGLSEGVGVMLGDRDIDHAGLSMPEYDLHLLGKFIERDDAMQFCKEVADMFAMPICGVTIGENIVHYAKVSGGVNAPYQADDNGGVRWFFSCHFSLTVTAA